MADELKEWVGEYAVFLFDFLGHKDKLLPQDPNGRPASTLVERVRSEKRRGK